MIPHVVPLTAPPVPLPARAEVAVIGGGIMGASIAYHLAAAGVRDVVVLERDTLGSGSSAKPLGGVRATFSDAGNVLLGLHSLRAFEDFENRFGTDIGLRQVGYLFLCRTGAELAAVENSARPHPTVPFTLDLSSTLYFHNLRNGWLLGISDRDEDPGYCREFSYGWTRAFDEAAAVVAPSLARQRLVGGWAGLYENTPDHNAMIGKAEVPGVLYATGFSGHGFLQGPAVGEVVRDLYLDREPFLDPAPFSASRFGAGALLREVHII